MDYTILGRTGLRVSVAGLGCGGPSRLGLRNSKSDKQAIALVRQALDMGVNLLDTAEAYGTEEVVGKAIAGFTRDQLVISTKKTLPPAAHSDPAAEVRKGLEQSLKRLKTDYVDIYHLHGVEPQEYSYASETLAAVFLRLREEGKIRFVGITEGFVQDPSHNMLERGLKENYWDVVMVGFNILNQSARYTVFSKTLKENIGVLVMFAVRRALSQPARLKEVWAELVKKGLVNPDSCDAKNPLGFLMAEKIVSTIPEAAYRFCRYEPGVHVVLTGTGSPHHLSANLDSLVKPPLPQASLHRLREMFRKVDCVTGN